MRRTSAVACILSSCFLLSQGCIMPDLCSDIKTLFAGVYLAAMTLRTETHDRITRERLHQLRQELDLELELVDKEIRTCKEGRDTEARSLYATYYNMSRCYEVAEGAYSFVDRYNQCTKSEEECQRQLKPDADFLAGTLRAYLLHSADIAPFDRHGWLVGRIFSRINHVQEHATTAYLGLPPPTD